ncbi:MAG: hypothetical protein HY763_05540 [Planctomycetes bacterium]|nr:hypothetical protein [Planctomycetota bacterium]
MASAEPRLEMKPVSSTGPHVVAGNEIFIGGGGVEVTIETLASGWGPPNNRVLKFAQGGIDPSGYLGANAVPPNAGVDLNPKGYAPPDPNGGNRGEGLFQIVNMCASSGRACGSPLPACSPAEGSCILNPRFFLNCCNPIVAVDTISIAYRYGAVVQFGNGAPDPGDPTLGYVATLILTVPSGVTGTYTVGFNPAESFMGDADDVIIDGVNLVPAKITVSSGSGCDDGNACTYDVGTPGNCLHSPNYDTQTECCDPTNGTIAPIDDGNGCTTDTCMAATGTVLHTPLPAGTACGDPADTDCSHPDTCDGAGACVGNHEPDGSPCDDGNPCTGDSCFQGTCYGTAAAVEGLPCDDGNFCTANDGCHTGQCVGDAGLADGTPCNDGSVCTGNDHCSGGACTGVNICVPTISLQPVSATGPYTVVGNEILLRDAGVEVTLEARFFGWSGATGSPQLRAAQAKMDSTSYLGANAEPPNPGFDLVPKGYAAPDPNGGNRSEGCYQATHFCSANGRACGGSQAPCAPMEGNCEINPRLFISCCNPIVAVDTSSINYRFGGVTQSPLAADDPLDPNYGYAATIVLQVPAGAEGTYTVRFDTDPNETFMVDQDSVLIEGLTLQDARITITHLDPAPLMAQPPYDRPKNRYVSFEPNYGLVPVAYRVELLDSELFPAATGVIGWVGPPDAEGAASILPSSTPLTAVTRVWTEGYIHVGDCEVSPRATYGIAATEDGVVFSPQRVFQTVARPTPKFWGDNVGIFTGGSWTAPNGVMNINDVISALQAFQGLASAPHFSFVDVQASDVNNPCMNRTVNISDVFLLLKAQQGEVYPFMFAPLGCPACP